MVIEYKRIDGPIFEKIAGMYGEWVRQYIIIREDTFPLAAMDGDIPAGFVCVTPRALPYPLEHVKDAYIEDLEVDENYRRRGIARHLITSAEIWAAKEGFRQIRTHHNDKAEAAIKLSESLNYGLCPWDYWIDGEKFSGYWVAKVLSAH